MRKSNSWLYIAILTLLSALLWAGVSAYASIRKSTIPSDVEQVMVPLNLSSDEGLFDRLQQRAK